MMRTLAIDIGGSGIKTLVLDESGQPQTERNRVETPQPANPDLVINAIVSLANQQGEFDRASAGFPGVVRAGVTETAVNLDPTWIGFDFAKALSDRLGKPVRVVNDADMQGMGAISGQGVELVITIGTGFGSALFLNGKLVSNLEMGHHEFRNEETYEQQLGRAALDRVGQKKWNRRLEKAISSLKNLFNYDRLYIGGGNTNKVTIELPPNVKIVPNVSGLLGGIVLWRD
ncbi:ROK family protein [Phormidesmis priestleyi]|uniref:ROK family protein n=1 Tax=Phormidesmis priestleyi TaxID=268141 RepID=UPI00083A7A93|nr:ROK family protein [Phormidesmis priestleyi]